MFQIMMELDFDLFHHFFSQINRYTSFPWSSTHTQIVAMSATMCWRDINHQVMGGCACFAPSKHQAPMSGYAIKLRCPGWYVPPGGRLWPWVLVAELQVRNMLWSLWGGNQKNWKAEKSKSVWPLQASSIIFQRRSTSFTTSTTFKTEQWAPKQSRRMKSTACKRK